MANMGSPGIIDLLYPGLQSHGIFLKVWVIMENKVIWAVLHLQTMETGKAARNQETFPRKMAKFRLWKNVEGHDT